MNPVKALQDHGQAVWLDFLSRGFIANGGLKKLVDDDGLRGVTSNPSIFEQAIGRTNEYDDGIQRMLHNEDVSPGQMFETLAVEDIRSATDVLRPIFDATHGADGFVSIEVSPYLAMQTHETIENGFDSSARRGHRAFAKYATLARSVNECPGLSRYFPTFGDKGPAG